MDDRDDQVGRALRRMGEPSWHILHVLEPSRGIPGIEIIRRVEEDLEEAGYPNRRLDPSTVHYALKRMEEDGLVESQGKREVSVPGPHGSERSELRSVYVITGLGERALSWRAQLERVRRRRQTGLASI